MGFKFLKEDKVVPPKMKYHFCLAAYSYLSVGCHCLMLEMHKFLDTHSTVFIGAY